MQLPICELLVEFPAAVADDDDAFATVLLTAV